VIGLYELLGNITT